MGGGRGSLPYQEFNNGYLISGGLLKIEIFTKAFINGYKTPCYNCMAKNMLYFTHRTIPKELGLLKIHCRFARDILQKLHYVNFLIHILENFKKLINRRGGANK